MIKSDLQLHNNPLEKHDHQTSSPVDSKELALLVAEAGDDRKADNIVILKVDQLSYVAEYFVIMTGYSAPQLKAISSAIEDKVWEKYHREPLRIEGKNDPNWILHDYGDVIAHIFLPEAREYYDLQAFWSGAEEISPHF
jgi:ribosome-associated protein